jgi:hypothetical protein
MGVIHLRHRDFRQARNEPERARRLPNASPSLRERVQPFVDRPEQQDTQNP